MTIFYMPYDKRSFFSAPQFNRVRHRYRGPRESWKINQEINQMTFSIYKFTEQFDTIHQNYLDNMAAIMSGGDLTGVTDSSGQQVTVDGLDSLVQRIISMDKRLKALES